MEDTTKNEEDSSCFDELEKDFQQVLEELVGDESLARFRVEFEKLHHALQKSNEHEKRLVKKCRELNAEIVNNASKVQSALKMSQEDQSAIASLKQELEKAWKMVDARHEKERVSKEAIQELNDKILELKREVEQSTGASQDREVEMQKVISERDDLARANEEQKSMIKDLNIRADDMAQYIEKMKSDKEKLKQENKALKETVETKNAEQVREARHRERFEKELKELKARLEGKQKEVDEVLEKLNAAEDRGEELENEVKESKTQAEKYLRDCGTLTQKAQKLNDELEARLIQCQEWSTENSNLADDIKKKNIEISKLSNECELNKRKIAKEKRTIEQMKGLIDNEKSINVNLQNQIVQLNKDLVDANRRECTKEKESESLKRAIEVQEKTVSREQKKIKHATDQVKIGERTVKNLENEICSYRQEASKLKKTIFHLEKERERQGVEASELNAKHQTALEQVKLKDMQIGELQKKVSEGSIKLKQQQQLYESVRSDRNLYSKNLIESQDEIAEMKRKFKIMNHQVEQLKEEISAKDHALVKEHFDHQKVDKQKDQLKNELSKMKSLLNSNEEIINGQNAEIVKLTHVIQKMDEEGVENKKDFEQVLSERDILGTQLIRRNDELALLYEKIKIHQSTLKRGESQYRERLQDIRVLKLKIADLKRQLHLEKRTDGSTEDLKQEIHNLHRDLMQEKSKVKALSEELENPMNVHRWRKLEGSDPAAYEMIQKIQTLQKRLIAKTEQVVEKDLEIQEKEKLYEELKGVLARQPGPEVVEQLCVYQQTLKDKTMQMKAMASELNMHQAQVNEFKYEIERLTQELQDVKRKYYLSKRHANNNQKEIADETTEEKRADEFVPTRIAGGGFNFSS